jgi:hypothetical protein
MIGEHPLQDCRLVGRQLRYLPASDHGWLGELGFGSAALHLEGRDEWIGWNVSQRRQHLERVINMTRFLIRPQVRCANLASHVLALCGRRVGGDFQRRYGLRPWLLESFVETPTCEGSCYQAANWILVGQTKGRGRNGPHQAAKSIKDVYLHPLADDFQDRVPKTRIISVSDREADMFELFDFRRCQTGRKAELLIRAKTDRCLEGTDQKLFAELALCPLAQEVLIQVPRQREQVAKPSTPGRPALPAREAQVEIRYKEVTLSAPNTSQTRNLQPLKLWAIYLVEKNPPPGAVALQWLLLTTIEVRSIKQALQCIRWYCRRWRIEEWHRVMKSGGKILEHQNHRAEVLLRAIAMDAVIAWRIMLLTLLGRELPQLPCEVVFAPGECEVLELLAKKNSPWVKP